MKTKIKMLIVKFKKWLREGDGKTPKYLSGKDKL
tara:strand:- start:876 stop:977 length:102 start_codon:yes stop_codon:yes gene_type:complete